MKYIFTLIYTLISLSVFSQIDTNFISLSTDSLKLLTLVDSSSLPSIEIVGIRSNPTDPITTTKINMDSVRSTYQGGDPFFTINQWSPNVLTQSDNGSQYGYSYMRIRGFDQTKINFTLNGIPLNEMEDQGIYFSNMPGFLNNISNIQVTRGIGTSQYGTTSIGGSVDMETNSPLRRSVRFNLNQGSFNNKQISTIYNSGFLGKSKFAFSSNVSYMATNGFREHTQSEGFNYFGQVGYFSQKNTVRLYGFTGMSKNNLSWQPVSQNGYNVYSSGFDTLGNYTTFNNVNYFQNGTNQNYRTNANGNIERDRFNQNFVALNWINYARSNLKYNSSLYFININGTYNTREPYYLRDIVVDNEIAGQEFYPEIFKYNLNSYQFGGMSNMVYNIGGFTFNTGINYNNYRREHRRNFYDQPTSLDSTQYYVNTGFKSDFITYSKINYQCNKFNYFVDLQYRNVAFKYLDNGSGFERNYINDILYHQWNFFNPKAGIKLIDDDYEAWISFGKTSREVTRTDLFYGYDDVDINDGVVSNPLQGDITLNFTPEQVYDAEIGHKLKFSNLNLSYNLYYMITQNERLNNGNYNSIGMPLKSIMNKVERKGFELTSSYNYKKLKVSVNGSYSLNNIFTDSPVITVPANTPTYMLNHSVSYGRKWMVSINGNLMSRIYLDNTNDKNYSTPQYYIMNFIGSYNGDRVKLSFTVNNILNKKYFLPGGIINNSTPNGLDKIAGFYPGITRSYFINATFDLWK